jgi:hypothetical protein
MKLYRAIKTINIRATPGTNTAVMGRIVAGQEFWSDVQEAKPGRQMWAHVLTSSGASLGWACVNDSLFRYLQEMPQPAPVADPLPPMPESPGGMSPDVTALVQRLQRIESDIKRLFELLKER